MNGVSGKGRRCKTMENSKELERPCLPVHRRERYFAQPSLSIACIDDVLKMMNLYFACQGTDLNLCHYPQNDLLYFQRFMAAPEMHAGNFGEYPFYTTYIRPH